MHCGRVAKQRTAAMASESAGLISPGAGRGAGSRGVPAYQPAAVGRPQEQHHRPVGGNGRDNEADRNGRGERRLRARAERRRLVAGIGSVPRGRALCVLAALPPGAARVARAVAAAEHRHVAGHVAPVQIPRRCNHPLGLCSPCNSRSPSAGRWRSPQTSL